LSRDIIIKDVRGRRTCSDADFPLRIGRGTQADIRLPDAGANALFAVLGRADGHVFVQPVASAPPVMRNGEALSGSSWLEHGDTLTVAGATVRYEVGATSITFSVDVDIVAPAITPPPTPPPATSAVPGPPSGERTSPRWHGRRIVKWLALSVFAVLVAIAGFVFMATPVSIEVAPTPAQLSVDGFWPDVEVGGRLLLIPGEYRVRASKRGYRPLDARVDIAGSEHQALAFTLDKLPGIVSFAVRPEVAATVSVDGKVVGTAPVRDVEIPAGLHDVTFEADRYAPVSTRLDVKGFGQRQSAEVEMSPLWSEVSIDSKPAGARVMLDGNDIGQTPLEAEILEGRYNLSLVLDGYDTFSRTFVVPANQQLSVPSFTLVESDGIVMVETTPAGANVSVGGKFLGRTPVELNLRPRRGHTITITKAGYESIAREITVEPAASEKLTLTMSPRYGILFVTSLPVDAELYIDDRLHGPATGRVRLTAKPHRIEVKKAGYESFTTTVTPRAGVSQQLSVTLKTIAQAKVAARKPVITTAEGQMLKLLEPARFSMGASRREQGRRANESQRLVEITRPYYLGVKEVSNGEFKRFKSDHRSGSVRGKSLNEASQPVAQVSWEDAVRYLNWLSAKDGLPPAYEKSGESFAPVDPPTIGYRLPTEAEWANAARHAGTAEPRKYSWGETFPPTGPAGNYADSAAATLLPNTLSDYGDGYPVSAPTGRFAATGPGFFDLGGNVAEWCQDFYAVYPGAARTLVTDPGGPAVGRHHVVRGSSWRHASISELRLSYRDYSEKARDDLGFRIARYAE
jgi:formylglycine-generating enzyme required for sulfatase activity